jgi:hypothetical protein
MIVKQAFMINCRGVIDIYRTEFMLLILCLISELQPCILSVLIEYLAQSVPDPVLEQHVVADISLHTPPAHWE